jgi:hypothetical protein
VGDRETAEELVQDVFTSVWRNSAGFDPARARFATWLYRITRNRATDPAPDAGGHIKIEDANGNMDVSLRAWGLPSCEKGDYYELWLVGGEERVSAGSFTVGPSGEINIHMNAPGFAGSYPAVGITYEYDEDPRASDANVLSGELH